jgi:hypothetical protein
MWLVVPPKIIRRSRGLGEGALTSRSQPCASRRQHHLAGAAFKPDIHQLATPLRLR